jgi:hypothetical protein
MTPDPSQGNLPKPGPSDSSATPPDRPDQPGTEPHTRTDERLARERREYLPKERHTWVSPVKTSKP